MKKAIGIVALATVLAFCIAEVLKAEPVSEDPCVAMSEMAGAIMLNRQKGVAMTRMMQIADDDELVRGIVIMAYEEPRYETDRNQANAVLDFRNLIAHACYSAD